MPSRILVVDDEDEIRRLVASYLIDDHFDVEELNNGHATLDRLQRQPAIDLVILDVRMPGMSGIDTLSELRRFSDVHVIMLTAASEETDRLIGLSVGADDYITKPFSPREVVARVKAVLRRVRATSGSENTHRHAPAVEMLTFDAITIDIEHHEVLVDGEPVELSALQFKLLCTMAESPRRVFARHQLIDRVWGRDFYGEERIVDVHVGNLRKALGDSASASRFIETVRGVGYRFRP